MRVVLFGGSYLETGAERFVVMLAEHPGIELVGGFFQSDGMDMRHQWRNLWQRRSWMAFPVAAYECGGSAPSLASERPGTARSIRQRARRIMAGFETVRDLHAPDVRERVSALRPDVGVIYGAPLLRAELYSIPRHGTLGIHHGLVPKYRGKKTTFWAMYNGERCAGVTIQRIDAGSTPARCSGPGRSPLAVRAIVASNRKCRARFPAVPGCASTSSTAGRFSCRRRSASLGLRKYRQPSAQDILRFAWRRLRTRAANDRWV